MSSLISINLSFSTQSAQHRTFAVATDPVIAMVGGDWVVLEPTESDASIGSSGGGGEDETKVWTLAVATVPVDAMVVGGVKATELDASNGLNIDGTA